MTIFRLPRWLRRLVRRNMNPMEEDQAWKMKDKLAIAYALIAWNACGYVMYQCFDGKKHWPTAIGIRSEEEDQIRPAISWANTLGIQKASVIRVSGVNVSVEEKFDLDTDSGVTLPPTPNPNEDQHSET